MEPMNPYKWISAKNKQTKSFLEEPGKSWRETLLCMNKRNIRLIVSVTTGHIEISIGLHVKVQYVRIVA